MASVIQYFYTVIVSVRHNLGKFPNHNRRCVRELCVKCVMIASLIANQELINMHFMYGLADINAVVAHHFYQERHLHTYIHTLHYSSWIQNQSTRM
jgi:hypothetical protein